MRHGSVSPSTGDAGGCDLARTFDYWSPAFAPDPYPLFRRLRADCPVARSDELDGYYILSRYEDVNAALRDHATFTSTVMTAPAIPVELRPPVPPLDQDPPSHTRYRQLLLPFFTPARAASLEAVARDTARRLAAACTGTIEAYMSYCFPMPTVVISQILGVDATDYPTVRRLDCTRPWTARASTLALPSTPAQRSTNTSRRCWRGANRIHVTTF